MYSRPTFVTKLDNHVDLLLSYLNTDDMDTTITTDISTTATSSSFNNDDAPFTPISTSHLLSPYPFPFTINSLVTQFMDSVGGGLTSTGISPGSLSHNESNLPPPPAFMAAPPPTSYTNTSSISPTLSMATAFSSSSSLSSDLDEPKRKRERKNQNGSKRRGRSSTTSTLLACKPILPARVTIGNKQRPSTIINHERMDTLDHQMAFNTNITVQQQQQQRNDPPPPPIDANTKRQERLIKNRAAALLSRKRKREHLQALEDEQEWLTKENEGLKSKAMALEIKLQQIEKEHQQQEEKILILEKQQQQQISCESNDTSNNDMHPIFYTMPPSLESLSTVTNVLMVSWKKMRVLGIGIGYSYLFSLSLHVDPTCFICATILSRITRQSFIHQWR
jgi:hypothetical protein